MLDNLNVGPLILGGQINFKALAETEQDLAAVGHLAESEISSGAEAVIHIPRALEHELN